MWLLLLLLLVLAMCRAATIMAYGHLKFAHSLLSFIFFSGADWDGHINFSPRDHHRNNIGVRASMSFANKIIKINKWRQPDKKTHRKKLPSIKHGHFAHGKPYLRYSFACIAIVSYFFIFSLVKTNDSYSSETNGNRIDFQWFWSFVRIFATNWPIASSLSPN